MISKLAASAQVPRIPLIPPGRPGPAARSVLSVLVAKTWNREWTSVLAHAVDTAAAVMALLALETSGETLAALCEGLGLREDELERTLAFLIALHDLGKLSPAFQGSLDVPRRGEDPAAVAARAAELAGARAAAGLLDAAALGARTGDRHRDIGGHGLLGMLGLGDLLAERGVVPSVAADLSGALGAHHGHFFGEFTNWKDSLLVDLGRHPAWASARAALVDELAYLLSPAPVRVDRLDQVARALYAGLCTEADWIASALPFSPVDAVDVDRDPAAYLARRRAEVTALLAREGFTRRTPLHDHDVPLPELFSYIQDFTPRDLQVVGEDLLTRVDGPRLIIAEAPTGEGKTEFALLLLSGLLRRAGHRGGYLAAPSMATGSALYLRLVKFLSLSHRAARGETVDVHLQHSGAVINEAYQAALADHTPGQMTGASDWFARRMALLSEYGAGTLDQLLLAVLPRRHHFVRLYALMNRVIIIDEAHAYDLYTGGLLGALLRWLRPLRCSVIIMTATLPAERRRDLVAAYAGEDAAAVLDGEIAARGAPYPRVSVLARDGRVEVLEPQADPERAHTVALHPCPPDVHGLSRRAAHALGDEGCLLVVVNTIDRAAAVTRALRRHLGRGDELLCLHSRMPAGTRVTREDLLAARIGRGAARPRRLIVVATQVVEQSLDIDADVLVTDLAPIDLLLQRLGRLHRHKTARPPAHDKARAYVTGLGGAWPTEGLRGVIAPVYDPFILSATWWALGGAEDDPRGCVLSLPGDTDRLVQMVYGADPAVMSVLPDVVAQLTAQRAEWRGRGANLQAYAVDREVGEPGSYTPERHLGGSGDAVHVDEPDAEDTVTRHGLPTAQLALLCASPEGPRLCTVEYGADHTWSVVPGDLARVDDLRGRVMPDEIRAALRTTLRVSRQSVVRAASADATPRRRWARSAHLRHLVPVVLEPRGGGWVGALGGVRLRLDPEVGLEYLDTP